MRATSRDDRGDVTTETVLVVPVLLLVITAIINFALWYHASQIARAATEEGARAAHVASGTVALGQTTAATYVQQLGSSLVLDPTINVTRDANSTRVELHAHSIAVVPGLTLPIHATTVSPTEVFRSAP